MDFPPPVTPPSLDAVLERMSDAFVQTDARGRIVRGNARFRDLAATGGCRAREFAGLPLAEVSEALEGFRRAAVAGGETTFEWTTAGGADAQPWRPRPRRRVRVFAEGGGHTLFVTECAEGPERLPHGEAIFRQLADANLLGVGMGDSRGHVIYANDEMLRMMGRTRADLEAGRVNWIDGHAPEDRARIPAWGEELARRGRLPLTEHVFVQPDGTRIPYAGAAVVVERDLDIHVSVALDLTPRRAAERQLRESEQIYRAIGESINYGVWITDADGRLVYVSDAFLQLVGYTAEEARDFNWSRVLHPDDVADTMAAWRECSRAGTFWEREHRFLGVDGQYHAVLARGVPMRDESGRIVRWVGINLDIAAYKRVEAELKQARDAAEAANAAKDRFLAALSHELRTPLTPVLLAAATAETDERLPAEARAQMAMIRRNVELETKLIDDLLDLSRVTSGKLALEFERVGINAALAEAMGICRPLAEEKGVQLTWAPDPAAGFIEADAARLQQMLWNLVSNAIKFTPAGGRVELRSERAADGGVRVVVRDSGQGIAPELLPVIFETFEQGDPDIARRFGGMGLGLAITRALAGLHRGRIRAESAGLGAGATFVLEFPAAPSPPPPPVEGAAAPAVTSAPPPLRILLVEDHADTAAMLGRLLRTAGFAVETAGTLAEGFARLEAVEHDLLLSDLGLPDGTGCDLMRAAAAKGVVGIAMSGYGMEADVERSVAAGFAAHLVKPVTLQRIHEEIARVITKPPVAG